MGNAIFTFGWEASLELLSWAVSLDNSTIYAQDLQINSNVWIHAHPLQTPCCLPHWFKQSLDRWLGSPQLWQVVIFCWLCAVDMIECVFRSAAATTCLSMPPPHPSLLLGPAIVPKDACKKCFTYLDRLVTKALDKYRVPILKSVSNFLMPNRYRLSRRVANSSWTLYAQ